jgi:hypothetical protein
MAWTSPRTWVSGELVTAAIMNSAVRDNLTMLDGGRLAITSQAAGDVLYASSSTALARLAKDEGKFLKSGASAVSWASVETDIGIVEGRLTASSGVPVTIANVSGTANIYFTPYAGNRIALYDGSSAWEVKTFTEITISLGGLTASKPYDVFAYNNSGTVTIETLVWTNTTTRATALVLQDGVLVKSGVTTRRYLGTVFINSSGAQTDDTFLKRYLWNYYNRISRPLQRLETTNSWTYTTATYRQANGSTANQVETCVGVSEALLNVNVLGLAANTVGDNNVTVQVGIDEGGTTANNSTVYSGPEVATYNAKQVEANLTKFPAVGWQKWVWVEKSTALGTTTFYGDNGGATQSGIYGSIEG